MEKPELQNQRTSIVLAFLALLSMRRSQNDMFQRKLFPSRLAFVDPGRYWDSEKNSGKITEQLFEYWQVDLIFGTHLFFLTFSGIFGKSRNFSLRLEKSQRRNFLLWRWKKINFWEENLSKNLLKKNCFAIEKW